MTPVLEASHPASSTSNQSPNERREFRRATPYPHLILDGFLEPKLVRGLTAEFPSISKMDRVGDDVLGRRSTIREFSRLGHAFAAVDVMLRSRPMLARLGALAGEPLIRNPTSSCGGLYLDENGAAWDSHLDANCQVAGYRRRLVFMLYLTEGWRPQWGGEHELYATARGAEPKKIVPLFNRAVIVACNERAWHGVGAIRLPPQLRATGRRAIIVNYYGRARRHDAPPHYNYWAPKLLPARLRPGVVLTPREARDASGLLDRRERLLNELQFLEASALRRPLPARSVGVRLRARQPLTAVALRAARAAMRRDDRELKRLYYLEFGYRRILACESR